MSTGGYGDSAGANRPLPNLTDPLMRPHWDAAREGRLELPRCQNCRFVIWPVLSMCPECASREIAWEPMSGRGKIWSWAVYDTALHPAFETEVPYVVALIELDEGASFVSNIVGAESETLAIGLEVRAVAEQVTPEITLIRFRVAGPQEVDTAPSR